MYLSLQITDICKFNKYVFVPFINMVDIQKRKRKKRDPPPLTPKKVQDKKKRKEKSIQKKINK